MTASDGEALGARTLSRYVSAPLRPGNPATSAGKRFTPPQPDGLTQPTDLPVRGAGLVDERAEAQQVNSDLREGQAGKPPDRRMSRSSPARRSALRTRERGDCNACRTRAGTASLHTRSISVSAVTTRPASHARAARTARWRRSPIG